MHLLILVALAVPMAVLSVDSPTFVMGIMSMAKDRDRRDAMRDTWTRNLKDRDDLKAFFVLGRLEEDHKEDIEKEMKDHGDIIVLECVENQHKGKTILWFEHVYRNTDFDFAVKVDQDVYVWTEELSSHIRALPRENFYGGHGPLYTNRRYWNIDKFAFFNGGFAILSRDLVGEVARVVSVAKEHQTEESKKNGFVIDTESLRQEHDIDLRGNEDVSLGRIFKPRLLEGTLKLNGGKGSDAAEFPWSLRNHGPIPNTPAPGEDVSLRTCPWRHSKDLKTAKGYRLYHEMYGGVTNSNKDCRCNCRPLSEILKVAPLPERKKLPPHITNKIDSNKKKKKDMSLIKMEDIKSRQGAKLNVKFHHKTDGIGGHVKMNFPVFAAAELFDLPLQCDNAALFNGHMSKTNPHIGNKLLLGCDENEISSWSRTVSKSKEEEKLKFKTWYDVFEVSDEVDFNVYGNRCGKQAPTFDKITTMKIPTSASKSMFNPPEKYLLRAGASFLRQGFVANTKPDEIASELWEEEGEKECFRVAIHWRTAMWSIRGMGTQGSVGEKFNRILARMVVKSNNPPSCVRVALITQRKEDEKGQHEVMKSIEKMKKNIQSLSHHLDIRVRAYISDSSKSVYDKRTELGGDPVDALIRDLSLLTTSHLMLCGKSQFTNMAAMLQRTDGVHVVTTDKDFSTIQQEGLRNLCQYLPNTVLAKDLGTRLDSASKHNDPLKAFLELPSVTKTCPDFDGTPVELFHFFGDCDEMDMQPRGGLPHRRGRGNDAGTERRGKRPPPQNVNRRRPQARRRGQTSGGGNKPRIQVKHKEMGGRHRRIQHEGL